MSGFLVICRGALGVFLEDAAEICGRLKAGHFADLLDRNTAVFREYSLGS